MTAPFPFTAIVGAEQLLEALLVNAVSPEVGGVLIRGERGTAKSTAVRALAPLLPPVEAASGQAFNFAPGDLSPGGPVPAGAVVESRAAELVELPVGASIDRLVGALDLGRALAGEKAFEAGLLARAHRGVLYVDEVNLLPDHLVDVLLDSAAMGVCHVERDAVSVRHDARFLLVGTMNAEEGDLRPQLLDRFGLGVEAFAPREPEVRAEIVRRRLAYEAGPAAFAASYADADAEVAARIGAARERLPGVGLPERELGRIVRACTEIGVDGVRGDVVTARAARALAALEGLDEVSSEHVRRAALMALAHRRRRDPLDGCAPDPTDVEAALTDPDEDPDDTDPPGPGTTGSTHRTPHDNGHGTEGSGHSPRPGGTSGAGRPDPALPQEDGEADRPDPALPQEEDRGTSWVGPGVPAPEDRLDAAARGFAVPLPSLRQRGSGARAGRSLASEGDTAAAIDSRVAEDHSDLALVASLRERIVSGDDAARRANIRSGREGALLCLVIDASGSMAARTRMARVKGALLGMLREAYARRDRVAIVAFRESRAEVVHAPGGPLEHAAHAVNGIRTGGHTPLAAGLDAATALIRAEAARGAARRSLVVVLTDGRVHDTDGAAAQAAARLGRHADAVHVVDAEEGPVRLGLAANVARAAGGAMVRLPSIPLTHRRHAA